MAENNKTNIVSQSSCSPNKTGSPSKLEFKLKNSIVDSGSASQNPSKTEDRLESLNENSESDINNHLNLKQVCP